MKITLPWRMNSRRGDDPVPKAYVPWLVLSLVVLVGSLFLLAIVVTAVFVEFGTATTPLWIVILGVLAVLGIGLGFAGFLLIMLTAGVKAWRESRRVQVLPPDERDERKTFVPPGR